MSSEHEIRLESLRGTNSHVSRPDVATLGQVSNFKVTAKRREKEIGDVRSITTAAKSTVLETSVELDKFNVEEVNLPPPPPVPRLRSTTTLSCGIFGHSWYHRMHDIECARSKHLNVKDGSSGDTPNQKKEKEGGCLTGWLECSEDGCLIGCLTCCFCQCCRMTDTSDNYEHWYYPDQFALRHEADMPDLPSRGLTPSERMEYRFSEANQGCGYIIVGLFDSETGAVRERFVSIKGRDDLFTSIRRASKQIRPLTVRTLSLKRVGGFSLYHCHPADGSHTTVQLDSRTSATLLELFREYSGNKDDFRARWKDWVHVYLNASSCDPTEGKYALQLVLRWSITKIIVYTSTPVLLSLIIGLWYMHLPRGDPYTITQTAWTISSYIVTTAGVLITLLAAITVLGDK